MGRSGNATAGQVRNSGGDCASGPLRDRTCVRMMRPCPFHRPTSSACPGAPGRSVGADRTRQVDGDVRRDSWGAPATRPTRHRPQDRRSERTEQR